MKSRRSQLRSQLACVWLAGCANTRYSADRYFHPGGEERCSSARCNPIKVSVTGNCKFDSLPLLRLVGPTGERELTWQIEGPYRRSPRESYKPAIYFLATSARPPRVRATSSGAPLSAAREARR